jgi:hypothetical protein
VDRLNYCTGWSATWHSISEYPWRESRMPVRIGYAIDAGNVIMLPQQMALQDSTKESSAPSHQYMGHQEVSSLTKLDLPLDVAPPVGPPLGPVPGYLGLVADIAAQGTPAGSDEGRPPCGCLS